jgi:hypothetical protein
MPTQIAQAVQQHRLSLKNVPVSIDRSCRCNIAAHNPYDLEMSPASLRDYNRDFVNILNEARLKSAHSIGLTVQLYNETMTQLRDTGVAAYHSLGDDFCRCWQETVTEPCETIYNLTFQSSTFPILWEFLYVGDPFVAVDPRAFWGYQYRITRMMVGLNQMPQSLESPERFLFCKNQNLVHWQDEQRALQEFAVQRGIDWMTLDDYLPSIHQEDRSLADSVLIAWTSKRFDIIHLASHLIASTSDADNILAAHLKLSFGTQDIQIPLRRLNAVRGTVRFQATPLVFLNACKSMTNPEHLSQGENFPQSFLKLGASAVIATACDVPDLFAKEFSCKFYKYLFENHNGWSPTLSEALHRTRQYFMDEFNNPLGLAYGLYAHSDLSIRWE